MEHTEKDLINSLQEAWRRLKDVQKRKNEAFPLSIYHGLRLAFLHEGPLPLIRNHVWYYLRELRALRKAGIQFR